MSVTLAHWLEGRTSWLHDNGVSATLVTDEVDRAKRAERLELRRAERFGTLLLWTNGDCEVDALTSDGTDMVSEYRTIGSYDDLEQAVGWLVSRL